MDWNARLRNRLRTDRRGGIEGMPLQLLIMVIVAGLALAVILGWGLSVPPPRAGARPPPPCGRRRPGVARPAADGGARARRGPPGPRARGAPRPRGRGARVPHHRPPRRRGDRGALPPLRERGDGGDCRVRARRAAGARRRSPGSVPARAVRLRSRPHPYTRPPRGPAGAPGGWGQDHRMIESLATKAAAFLVAGARLASGAAGPGAR